MSTGLKIWSRLRVAVLALALALGWIAAPLSRAVWARDACQMECCLAEGSCCCQAQQAAAESQQPNDDEVSLNSGSTLSAPCPSGCSASRVASQNYSRRAELKPEPFAARESTSIVFPWELTLFDNQAATRNSPPRAPPVSDGQIA